MKLTYMSWANWINKPWRLRYKNSSVQITMKKCFLHIQLMKSLTRVRRFQTVVGLTIGLKVSSKSILRCWWNPLAIRWALYFLIDSSDFRLSLKASAFNHMLPKRRNKNSCPILEKKWPHTTQENEPRETSRFFESKRSMGQQNTGYRILNGAISANSREKSTNLVTSKHRMTHTNQWSKIGNIPINNGLKRWTWATLVCLNRGMCEENDAWDMTK